MPLLDQLKKEYYSSGFKPKSEAARLWFMNRVQSFKVTPEKLMVGEGNTPFSMLGNMFFFMYDAKWKDELPYWDKFPLVIPMEFYRDSFLGINLHYIDYQSRAILLDKMQAVSSIKRIDEHSRFKVRYDTIRNVARFREVKPCIKKYLYNHVRSPFLKVESSEWEVAIFLPVHRFVGAKAEDIWEGNV